MLDMNFRIFIQRLLHLFFQNNFILAINKNQKCLIKKKRKKKGCIINYKRTEFILI